MGSFSYTEQDRPPEEPTEVNTIPKKPVSTAATPVGPAVTPVGQSENMRSFSDFLSGYLPPELRGLKSDRRAPRAPQQQEPATQPRALAANEPYRPGALIDIKA
jgi:hypothetical protein